MFHLTWKGMIGRRKESSLLLIVLVLSFLLSSALAIILPSTQAEAQLQRESSYGSWKLMLLERSSEECEALAQALSEQGAQCAVLPSVSLSSEGELTSVMTPEAMTLGNFRLLEGRLPEAENEILLVENQFAIGALPEVGENITVRFVWSAEAADAEVFEQQQRRCIDEAFDRGLTQLIPSRMDEYLAFIAGAKENWQRDRTSVTYPYLTRDCLGRDEPVDPKNMTPEELEVSIKTYLRDYVYFSESREFTAKEPVLISSEDFYFTALRTTTKLTLTGELYGELAGQTIQLTNAYTEVSANIPYTVCGILKAYEATWDTGGHDMPDAFLSTAGREKILRCIASAQEQVEDLEFYYDKNQRSSTLLISSPASVAMLYDEAAASESALAQPYWEQIRYSEDAWGGQDTTVEFHAWDPAANCEVYRKGYIDYAEDGTVRYVYPDVLDENGQPFSFTDEELASPDFQFPGLERIRPTFEYPPLDEQYEKNEFATRVNTYAYPKETGASGTSSTVLNGILVLISACAVLVICVVQSKRRAHSLVLLRSIGLQPGQAAVMQLTEALLFLALSLLIGLPLGYLAASAALHRFYHISVLAFDTGFLLRSAIFGAFSLLLGLQLPLLYSLRLPLTGRASAAVRKLPKRGQLRRDSLLEMEYAAAKFNRRRSFLARLLCALGLLLALLTLLLSHFAFDDYRSNVGRSNMPDYVMTAPYAMRPRFLRQKMEEYAASDALGSLPPARLDSYLAAENVTLADYEDSPVLSELSHTVRIAGMKEDNSILQELLAYTGPIDTKKLLSGEGCILLMPYYKDNRNGSQRYSSDPVDAYRYKTDDSIQTGDILSLSADTHHLTEREVVKETNHASVEVLAVLHEYPGIWLFGSGAAPGILISGQTLITEIYPNAAQSYSAEEIRWIPYNNLMHCEYCHGKTYFQFYSPDAEDHTATCWNLAEAEGLEMKNNFREKEERLAACQSQRVMTVLLGAAAVLLVMIILLFILSDMAEQERRRIGILRALGASKTAIWRTHWLLALREGLWAVLLSNAAYALILLVCAFFETGFHTLSPAALVTTLTQGLLWQYPWSLHLCLCLVALVLITLLRVLPYHRLCQSSVIGTIKGLERGE